MTTAATDGKMLVNSQSAVVFCLAEGYAGLGKMAIGGIPTKLDFTPRGPLTRCGLFRCNSWDAQ